MAEARKILSADPVWQKRLRGDLHMHTTWSDGSATVEQMADAGRERRYEYISLTDHSKGLKIAAGIDEAQIAEQAREIAQVNEGSAEAGMTVLHSIELNLNPKGEGDMEAASLANLDLVLGSFHSSLRVKEDQTERYLAALRILRCKFLVIRGAGFTTIGSDLRPSGHGFSPKQPDSTKRSRSTATPIGRT